MKKKRRIPRENEKKTTRNQTISRNLIIGINTWAVFLVRYSGPFFKWAREELKQIDERTRKLMTMHKTEHPRDDVDRLYVPRKEGGRRLTSIQYSVNTSIQRLEDFIKMARRKTDYSDPKAYWQHEEQQNGNKQKTKIGKKTTVQTFQATNKQNLTREDVGMAKKENP